MTLALQEIPAEVLGEDMAQELAASFATDPNDDYRCAALGRLWENLRDKHPNVPFLILRVADMRLALGEKVTALALYQKVGPKFCDH